MNLTRLQGATALLMILLLAGCENENERAARIAERMSEQQSQQNQAMAKQNQQIVLATQTLVEADSASRTELIALQKDLQQEQGRIASGWESLEIQRQEIAGSRYWDSALAVAVEGLAILLAASVPLVLSWALLRGAPQEPDMSTLNELLVLDMVADSPVLLPAPPSRPTPTNAEPVPSLPAPKAAKAIAKAKDT